MPGPAPKHPSIRSRARDAKRSGFRTITGLKGSVPPWPLQADVRATATMEMHRDHVAALQLRIEQTTDGRKRGPLTRQLTKLELAVAELELQIEQAVDLETSLWAELWAMPQAEIWEESRAHREVAQYVRWKIRAEMGDLKAATEARMLSDRLGLNPLALLKLRAEIEQVDEAETRGRERRSGAKPAARSRKPKGEDPRSGLYAV